MVSKACGRAREDNVLLSRLQAALARLFIEDRAQTLSVIAQAPAMGVGKSRDLCFAVFRVLGPDTTQVVLVNGAVLCRSQLLLNLLGEILHTPPVPLGVPSASVHVHTELSEPGFGKSLTRVAISVETVTGADPGAACDRHWHIRVPKTREAVCV
jgi:hypothetical protein